ncbi:MAG: hypothetical protein HY040_03545 [Planctomycetes bacterium]|nr:hypothetical protein [Planctomycetota bacterium]
MDQINGQRIADAFDDDQEMERAMGEAVRSAVRTHKLLGQPIVIWRDGKVVWVPPEEIEVDERSDGNGKS